MTENDDLLAKIGQLAGELLIGTLASPVRSPRQAKSIDTKTSPPSHPLARTLHNMSPDIRPHTPDGHLIHEEEGVVAHQLRIAIGRSS